MTGETATAAAENSDWCEPKPRCDKDDEEEEDTLTSTCQLPASQRIISVEVGSFRSPI